MQGLQMNYSIYLNTKKLNTNDAAAMKEYQKRLSAYCRIESICRPAASLSVLLPHIKNSAHTAFILIQPGKATPSSEELAESINQIGIHGISTVCFFIGYDTPDLKYDTESLSILSLSYSELSIGLTGVVLQEQLYRSYRILNHQPYHK